LLTWFTAYWTTGTIATSFAMYTETDVVPGYVDTPTGWEQPSAYVADLRRALQIALA
jgi:hypothetical protein